MTLPPPNDLPPVQTEASQLVGALVGDPAPATDTWTVRIVVMSLALIAFAVIIGQIYLTAVGRTLPDTIIVIGSGSAGALGGLLASTRSTSAKK